VFQKNTAFFDLLRTRCFNVVKFSLSATRDQLHKQVDLCRFYS